MFALALIGIAIIFLNGLFAADPTPLAVAEQAERLLNGNDEGWDVDDYEHLNRREPRMRDLWRRTMEVGGLPEEWVRLDESKKLELRDIIRVLRELPVRKNSQ